MSNPVSDAQVEDVLSSIRRLVSSDIRPVGREPEEVASPLNEPEETVVDRLVLSPALRVAAAQDVASGDVETSADCEQKDTQEAEQSGPPDEATPLNDRVEPDVIEADLNDSLDKVAEAGDAAPEPDFPSNEIDPEALRFLFRARKRPRSAVEPDENDAVIAGAVENDEPIAHAPEPVESGEIEKPSPLLLTNPEPGPESGDAVTDVGAGDGERSQRVAPDEVPDENAESANVQASNANGDTVPPQELTAKIAVLESVIAQTSDQWEPDDEGADEYAGTSVDSLEWEDHLDLDASGAPRDRDQVGRTTQSVEEALEIEADVVEPEEAAQEDLISVEQEAEVDQLAVAVDVAGDEVAVVGVTEEISADPQGVSDDHNLDQSDIEEEAVLDEEALRELVSDIVRQELNGKLGERITHNVRKLVRRELQRALASQDLG